MSTTTTTTTENPSDSNAIRVAPYDGISMKQILDESVVKLVLEKTGHQEDTALSNLKIFIAVICCVVALLSHFYPKPFPDNRNILIACSVTYFGLNFVLQLLAWFKEKNFIVFTIPQKNSKVKDALEVASSLDRLEPFYHISIAPRNKPSALHTVTKEFNITEFFDATGKFYEANFFTQLKPVLQEFVNNNKSTN